MTPLQVRQGYNDTPTGEYTTGEVTISDSVSPVDTVTTTGDSGEVELQLFTYKMSRTPPQ